MSYKPKYFGTAHDRNGRIVFVMMEESKEEYEKFMSRQKPGQELEMTMVRKHKPRTTGAPGEETNFNGYLWGVVYKIIGDKIGEWDMDDIHLWAQKAVGNVKRMPDGEKVPLGTSHMSGAEFADYCRRVRMWAGTPGKITNDGIWIPEPNEVEIPDV